MDMNINIIGMMACDWAGPVIFILYIILPYEYIEKKKKVMERLGFFSPLNSNAFHETALRLSTVSLIQSSKDLYVSPRYCLATLVSIS